MLCCAWVLVISASFVVALPVPSNGKVGAFSERPVMVVLLLVSSTRLWLLHVGGLILVWRVSTISGMSGQ